MAMLIPAALSSMSGLATAGAALSAASGVLGTVSSVQNANAQAKSLDAAATAERRATAMDAAKERRANRLAAARDRAGALENGAASGTMLDLLGSNAKAREFDVLTNEFNGAGQANALTAQANNTRAQIPGIAIGGLMQTAASSPFLTDSAGRAVDPLNYGS